jgi:hypothetical protein
MPTSKKSPHKHTPKKKENNTHQTIKPWHRIGALVLVAALILSMVAMYAF